VDLSTIANLINALAVTAGVIFAAVQIRHYGQRRRRDAMLELVRSFQNAAFTRALRRIAALPDGANAAQIREKLGDEGEDDAYLVILTWESLGVLTFRREVTLDLIDDFFSGTIAVVAEIARVSRRRAPQIGAQYRAGEWFQWLAERMMEREKNLPPVPAYIAHRDRS
jgi:hypothetical protein